MPSLCYIMLCLKLNLCYSVLMLCHVVFMFKVESFCYNISRRVNVMLCLKLNLCYSIPRRINVMLCLCLCLKFNLFVSASLTVRPTLRLPRLHQQLFNTLCCRSIRVTISCIRVNLRRGTGNNIIVCILYR